MKGNNMKPEVFVLDVDGVLTDGGFIIRKKERS